MKCTQMSPLGPLGPDIRVGRAEPGELDRAPTVGHQVEVPQTSHLSPLSIRIHPQHSDPAILVHPIESDPSLLLGLPHLPHQVTAPPSQLEVEVEVSRGELGVGVLVLAG